MRKFLIALSIVLAFAISAVAAEEAKSSISFGYGGLAVAKANSSGVPDNGVVAGLSFDVFNVASLDLTAQQSQNINLYSIDFSPRLGKYIFFPYGISYLDAMGQTEYGANLGVGVRLFPAQHLGLKFIASGLRLRNPIADEQNFVGLQALATLSF